MRHCVLGALLLALAAICASLPSAAQRSGTGNRRRATAGSARRSDAEMRIAAVVNDEVISVFDLISRLRMVLLSSNIPDSPEARQRVEAQVLRSLVDEKLQLQEAKKQNVVATDDEVNNALGQIEKQNNMQPGQLNRVPQGARHRPQLADQSGDRLDRLGQAGPTQAAAEPSKSRMTTSTTR
jgi:parvulin-like peptidyl-prolyl isomerase